MGTMVDGAGEDRGEMPTRDASRAPRHNPALRGEAADATVVPIPRGDDIELAAARGDAAQVVSLIDASPIEAWFAVPPDRMLEILSGLSPSAMHGSGAVHAFRLLLQSDPVEPTGSGDGWRALGEFGGGFFDARVHGQPLRAAAVLDRGGEVVTRANALFDETAGWRAFIAVQTGIQSILAGEYAAALAAFSRAVTAPPPRTLAVLHRDAMVKGALVHALFGDPAAARRDLDVAATVVRTQSWAEAIVDAHAEIAEAVLLADTLPDAAIDRLEHVPIALVGELLPLRLLATATVYLRAGRPDAGRRRIDELDHFPAQATDGLPRVAPALARSAIALIEADFIAAADVIAADPGTVVVDTGLVRAVLDLVAGDEDAAILRLTGLGPRTAGLSRLEAGRAIALAWALLRKGDEKAAEQTLRALREREGADMPLPLAVPQEIHRFAVARVPGWPVEAPIGFVSDAEPRPRLTEGERRLLPLLAAGLTREQMASELFVSVNTVKTQQRSLFRKLGVSSRVDALVVADRLQLI